MGPAEDARRPGSSALQPSELADAATAMESLSPRGHDEDHSAALHRVVAAAVTHVPHARWASVSLLRRGRFWTGASSDGVATEADRLQYETGSGPCVDAILEDSVNVSPDVDADPRWPVWGGRVRSELGVRSALCQRLHLHDEPELIAGLNIYSDEPAAFDDRAVTMGVVLATHAAVVLSEMFAAERVDNLRHALESNREIGVAMGILMQRHRLTRDQAFDALRLASQDTNRKLADVAAEVADTGILETRRAANETRRAPNGR